MCRPVEDATWTLRFQRSLSNRGIRNRRNESVDRVAAAGHAEALPIPVGHFVEVRCIIVDYIIIHHPHDGFSRGSSPMPVPNPTQPIDT